jgi:hypothetical protein
MKFAAPLTVFMFGGLAVCQPAAVLAADAAAVPIFSAEEVAWSKGYGPNIIDGIAALSGDKDTATCAGEEVYLRPGSALERHRNKIIFGNADGARISVDKFMNPVGANAATMPTPPKDYDAIARKGSCSIDGKFLFAGIPDGEYYAVTMLFPRAYLGKVVPMENIEVIMKRISVAGGQMVKVDLFSKP